MRLWVFVLFIASLVAISFAAYQAEMRGREVAATGVKASTEDTERLLGSGVPQQPARVRPSGEKADAPAAASGEAEASSEEPRQPAEAAPVRSAEEAAEARSAFSAKQAAKVKPAPQEEDAAETESAPEEAAEADTKPDAAESRLTLLTPGDAAPEGELSRERRDVIVSEPAEGEAGDGRPTFDVVRVDPDGSAVVAGRAEPGAQVGLTADGRRVGGAVADNRGEWVIIPDESVGDGSTVLALEAVPPGGGEPVRSSQTVTVALPEAPKTEVAAAEEAPKAPAAGAASTMPPPRSKPARESQVALAEPAPGAPKTRLEGSKVAAAPPRPQAPPRPAPMPSPSQSTAGKSDAEAPAAPQSQAAPSVARAPAAKGDAEVAAASPRPEAAPSVAQAPAEEGAVEIAAAASPEQQTEQRGGPYGNAVGETPDVPPRPGSAPDVRLPKKTDTRVVTTPQRQEAPTQTPATQRTTIAKTTPRPSADVEAEPAPVTPPARTEPSATDGESKVAARSPEPETEAARTPPARTEPSPAKPQVTESESRAAASTPKPETEEASVAATSPEPRAAPDEEPTAPSGPLVVLSQPGQPSRVLQTPGSPPAEVPSFSFESVDYDDAGEIIISGRVEPGADVRAYVGGEVLGDAKANAQGRWVLKASRAIDPGTYQLRVDRLDETGAVIARVAAPFERVAPEIVAGARQRGEVVIQPGDNLWNIARAIYGSGTQYTAIYDANKNQIGDPDLIYPGQIFLAPGADPAGLKSLRGAAEEPGRQG